MAKMIPFVRLNECMACRVCVLSCPENCLEESLVGIDRYNKAYPELKRPEDCTGCRFCARSCPVEAIDMVAPGS